MSRYIKTHTSPHTSTPCSISQPCTHRHTHRRTDVHACIHPHAHIQTNTPARRNPYPKHTHTHTHTHTQTHKHAHIQTCTHTNKHTCTARSISQAHKCKNSVAFIAVSPPFFSSFRLRPPTTPFLSPPSAEIEGASSASPPPCGSSNPIEDLGYRVLGLRFRV